MYELISLIILGGIFALLYLIEKEDIIFKDIWLLAFLIVVTIAFFNNWSLVSTTQVCNTPIANFSVTAPNCDNWTTNYVYAENPVLEGYGIDFIYFLEAMVLLWFFKMIYDIFRMFGFVKGSPVKK